jgi:hypothetical protein
VDVTSGSATYQITATGAIPGGYSASIAGISTPLSVDSSGLVTIPYTVGAGVRTMIIRATNMCGMTGIPVTLTVVCTKPSITNSSTATVDVTSGSATYQITASGAMSGGYTVSISGASPQPTVNSSGLVTIPSTVAAGTQSMTIGASNLCGTTTLVVTLTVVCTKPTITNSSSATVSVHFGPANYAITATGAMSGGYSASYLSGGISHSLTVDSSGNVTIPTALGGATYTMTIGASNLCGTTTMNVSLTVMS